MLIETAQKVGPGIFFDGRNSCEQLLKFLLMLVKSIRRCWRILISAGMSKGKNILVQRVGIFPQKICHTCERVGESHSACPPYLPRYTMSDQEAPEEF